MNSFQLAYLSKKSKEFLPVKVTDVRYAKSMKYRECTSCGNEIPKGDMYYSFKAIFSKRKARCLDCPPKIYNDINKEDLDDRLDKLYY